MTSLIGLDKSALGSPLLHDTGHCRAAHGCSKLHLGSSHDSQTRSLRRAVVWGLLRQPVAL